MSPETKLLVLCYLILFLYFFFAFIYSRDRLNLFRDQLQAIRARLLAHVHAGDLRPDSYAYNTAQTIVTGVLRYASCYSIPLILFHCATQRRWIRPGRKRHLERRFRDALEELSPAGRAAVKEALDELHFRVLSHVLHVSVLFWLPLQIFKTWLWIRSLNGSDWDEQLAKLRRKAQNLGPVSSALAIADLQAHEEESYYQLEPVVA